MALHNHTDAAEPAKDWRPGVPLPASEANATLRLELEVRDAEVITALNEHPSGRAQREFALRALRIGVLALRQAQGQVDADAVRRESDRLLGDLASQLEQHRARVTQEIGTHLKDYFDPASGRFTERVERLVRKDGELESALRRQLGEQDSELARTLTAHVGAASPLMKVLNPEASTGLLQNLRGSIEKALQEDRERIVAQFSLDNSDSALSRLVGKITDANGQLTKEMQGSLDQVVKEFSLDSEDSALSRLVRQVDNAQKQISAEFSLDQKSSALARMKEELLGVLGAHAQSNAAFQQEVREALSAMQVRRQESLRSTAHGGEFEDQLFSLVQARAQRAGDIATHVGDSAGSIRHCKKGDICLELGPEHAAAGARVVIEAKEDASYDLARARTELDEARPNRKAEVGVFVFSRLTAPEGLEPLARYGKDIIAIWDAEDETTDIWLDAALTVARALCSRAAIQRDAQQTDFEAIDRAIREIEKQARGLDDIHKWTTTIKSSSDKILGKIDTMSGKLRKQIDMLDDGIEDLKQNLEGEA